MKRVQFAFAVSAIVLLTSQSAHAALNAYLQLKGSKTLKINSATPSGWYNALCTNEAFMAIVSPRDPASGQATGKRTHKPLRARMVYDQAAANNLRRLFQTKSPIGEITVLMHKPAQSQGKEHLYYKIVLTDCRIVSYQLGTMDGKPAVTIDLAYDSAKHQAVSKTVNANAWMTDINFGSG